MKSVIVFVLALIVVSHATITFNQVTTCCSDGQYVKKSDSNKCTACAAWCASCDMAQNGQDQDGKKEGGVACPCKLEGCKTCTVVDDCTACKVGYVKLANAKVCTACATASNCKECETTAVKCKNCNDGFYKHSDNTCKACVANCAKCTTAADCSECKYKTSDAATGDYVQYKDDGAKKCTAEVIHRCAGDKLAVSAACVAVTTAKTNCVVYGNKNEVPSSNTWVAKADQTEITCVKCKAGWKVTNHLCVSTTLPLCTLDQLYVLASNSCVAGTKGCKTKNATGTECTECKDGYYIANKLCVACKTGAKTCNATKCLTPKEGYCAEKSDLCAALANSKTCDNAGKATACIDGFVKETDVCNACTIANCKTCATKAECDKDKCKDGYYGADNKLSCTICTAGKNCLKCAEVNKCTSCKDNSWAKVADVCVTIEGCKEMESAANKCKTCKDGYARLTDQTKCIKCAEGYKTCNINCSGRGVGTCFDHLKADKNTCKCKDSKVWKNNLCVAAAGSSGDTSGGSSSSSSSAADSSSGSVVMTFQIVLFALISMFLF